MPEVQRGPNDDPSLSDDELVAQRTAWFKSYLSRGNVTAKPSAIRYSCPCCGHRTLRQRGGYDICRECKWEE